MKFNKKLSALLLASYMSLSSIGSASADTVTPDDNTSKLNIRSGASIEASRITGIPNGENAMRIMSCENNWDVVVYKDNIGYVCRDYLKVVNDNENPYLVSPISYQVLAADNVRMRLGPGTSFPVIGSLSMGENANVIGVSSDGFVLLNCNGKLGFVDSRYLVRTDDEALREEKEHEFISSHSIVYTIDSVNLRKGPGTEYEKYTTLKPGVGLSVVGYEKGFYQVIYEGNYYYVSAEFTSTNPNNGYRDDISKVVYADANDVNVRSDGNNSSSVIYVLDRYEVCEVIGDAGEYYMVRVNNVIGYVNKNYVKSINNTFVVIDISEQELTVYDDNQIYLETPVVTGQEYLYDTPKGMYTIGSKETNKVLKSAKYGYETPVNYWIPVNGGVGIHDATWRGKKFGGTIYKNNGSHGCINVPLNQAQRIYDHVKSKSTKVFIHK